MAIASINIRSQGRQLCHHPHSFTYLHNHRVHTYKMQLQTILFIRHALPCAGIVHSIDRSSYMITKETTVGRAVVDINSPPLNFTCKIAFPSNCNFFCMAFVEYILKYQHAGHCNTNCTRRRPFLSTV